MMADEHLSVTFDSDESLDIELSTEKEMAVTLSSEDAIAVDLSADEEMDIALSSDESMPVGLNMGGGEDGFSPIARVTKEGSVATITITDKDGTTSAKVYDGANGKDGMNGEDGVPCSHYWSGTTLTVISSSGISSADLKGDKGDPGVNGTDGADGADGYTPVKGVDYFDGEDGYTPIKGVDYFDGTNGVNGKDGTNGTNGKDGADGKSAYEYAKDGGYTGSESQFAKDINPTNLKSDLVNIIYPVGSIYLAYNHVNPSTLFGGSWVRIEGRFLWATTASGTIGSTGGESTHTLTINEMPSHNHDLNSNLNWDASNGTIAKFRTGSNGNNYGKGNLNTAYVGGGQPHNNMPPYIEISAWRRTA